MLLLIYRTVKFYTSIGYSTYCCNKITTLWDSFFSSHSFFIVRNSKILAGFRCNTRLMTQGRVLHKFVRKSCLLYSRPAAGGNQQGRVDTSWAMGQSFIHAASLTPFATCLPPRFLHAHLLVFLSNFEYLFRRPMYDRELSSYHQYLVIGWLTHIQTVFQRIRGSDSFFV